MAVRKKGRKICKKLVKICTIKHTHTSITESKYISCYKYTHSCVLIGCRGVRSRDIGSRSVRCGSRDIRSCFGSNIGSGSDVGCGCRDRVGRGCRGRVGRGSRGRVGRGRGIGFLEKGLVRAGLALVLYIGVVLLVLVHIVVHNLQPAVRQLNLKNPGVKEVSECSVIQTGKRKGKSAALATREKFLENSVIKMQIHIKE